MRTPSARIVPHSSRLCLTLFNLLQVLEIPLFPGLSRKLFQKASLPWQSTFAPLRRPSPAPHFAFCNLTKPAWYRIISRRTAEPIFFHQASSAASSFPSSLLFHMGDLSQRPYFALCTHSPSSVLPNVATSLLFVDFPTQVPATANFDPPSHSKPETGNSLPPFFRA